MYKIRTQELEVIKKHLKSIKKHFNKTLKNNVGGRTFIESTELLDNNEKLIKLIENNFYV